jgi:hypothetical protein
VPTGTTEDAWVTDYRESQVDPTRPDACNPSPDDLSTVTIDGRPASLRIGCGEMEALVFAGDRVYSFAGWIQATTSPGVPDDVRAEFEAFLTTIMLTPETALDPQVASPSPG